jgi:hypothetical protein
MNLMTEKKANAEAAALVIFLWTTSGNVTMWRHLNIVKASDTILSCSREDTSIRSEISQTRSLHKSSAKKTPQFSHFKCSF